MDLDLFDYHLPKSYIAQTPASPRDTSRLLILRREDERLEGALFYQLPTYLKRGDHLVFNNTRVIPARIFGKTQTGGQVEVLLLQQTQKDLWEALVRPGSKVHPGDILTFSATFKGQVRERTDYGGRILRLEYEGDLFHLLDEIGEMPLPPYIKEGMKDREDYQTIYGKIEGAVAAPTAGLHFTPGLLLELRKKGIQLLFLTLHVGLGTFRPVKVKNILEHRMHGEYYVIGEDLVCSLNRARQKKERIIAVGTTVIRALETALQEDGTFKASKGYTDLFIHPGNPIGSIDGLITNFHLPRSSLLMMISAFIPRERLLSAYEYAKEEGYRFYSFGDAMLIL